MENEAWCCLLELPTTIFHNKFWERSDWADLSSEFGCRGNALAPLIAKQQQQQPALWSPSRLAHWHWELWAPPEPQEGEPQTTPNQTDFLLLPNVDAESWRCLLRVNSEPKWLNGTGQTAVPVSTHGRPPPIAFQSHCALHLACDGNWTDHKWRWRLWQLSRPLVSYLGNMLWLYKWGHSQTLRLSKLKAYNSKIGFVVSQMIQHILRWVCLSGFQAVEPLTVQILTWKHRSLIGISCSTCGKIKTENVSWWLLRNGSMLGEICCLAKCYTRTVSFH